MSVSNLKYHPAHGMPSPFLLDDFATKADGKRRFVINRLSNEDNNRLMALCARVRSGDSYYMSEIINIFERYNL